MYIILYVNEILRKAQDDKESLRLFIVVVTIGGEDVHINLRLENAVNEPMLFGNLSAPSVFGFAFQRFRMSGSRLGVFHKLVQQFDSFLETGRFTAFQLAEVGFGLGREGDFIHGHKELSQAFISLG